MINSFNAKVASDFNLNVAVFLQHLSQWSFYNLVNNRNIHDGHVWTYETLDAMDQYFPYWTRRQIEYVIKTAVDEGLVIKGNYNKNSYDRTCWYALTPKGMMYYPELKTVRNLEILYSSISQNCEMDITNWCNEIHKIVITIPTNNPSINKNISKDIYIPSKLDNEKSAKKTENKKQIFGIDEMKKDNPHDIPDEMINDWLDVRRSKKAKVTSTAWNKINKTLQAIKAELNITAIDAFETMVASGWQSLKLEYFFKPNLPTNKSPTHYANGLRRLSLDDVLGA